MTHEQRHELRELLLAAPDVTSLTIGSDKRVSHWPFLWQL